jgi:hypothetical protein
MARERIKGITTFQPTANPALAGEYHRQFARNILQMGEQVSGLLEGQAARLQKKEDERIARITARQKEGGIREGKLFRKEQEEKGALEGATVQRDEAGQIITPQLKAGVEALTPYGSSFNAAAIQAYGSAAENDLRLHLVDLGEQYKDDPEGYETASQTYISTTLKEMPPEIAAAKAEQFRYLALNKGTQVASEFEQRERERQRTDIIPHLDSLNDDIQRTSRIGSKEESDRNLARYTQEVEAAVQNETLTEKEGMILLEKAKQEQAHNQIVGTFEDVLFASDPLEGIAEAEKYLAGFMEFVPPGLSPEERDKLLGDMRSILNQRKALYQGDVAARKEAQERQASLSRVEDVLNGKAVLDHDLPQDQADNELYYTEIVSPGYEEKGITPVERRNADTAYVRLVGFAPETMHSNIRKGIRSGDPAQMIDAADMVSRLQDVLPPAYDPTKGKHAISDDDLAVIEEINALIDAGQTPEQAVENATNAVDPNNRNQRNARLEQIEGKNGHKSLREKYDGYIEDFSKEFSFWGTDAAPHFIPVLRNDFADVFENAFIRTGNVDTAKKIAFDSLKKKWGESGVNNDEELMPHPPESYYSLPGADNNSAWMKEQLYNFLSNNTRLTHEQIKELGDQGRIQVRSDLETARMAGHANPQPDYPIFIQWQGQFEPFLIDGMITRWKPRPEQLKAIFAAENQLEMVKAMEQQEVEQAAAAYQWRLATGQVSSRPFRGEIR